MLPDTFKSVALERKLLNEHLPASNGIYQFVKGDEIVYVGKSVNIKARVLSHIEAAKLDNKEAAIVRNSDSIRYFVTDTEFKALLLESQLIRSIKPVYNVRWRDDKSYLYIKISIKDEYPKVFLSRHEEDPKARYFGPFPSVRTTQDIIRSIRRVFPFDTQKNLSKRACFYSKIGLCNPCPNVIQQEPDLETKKELQRQYKLNIRRVMRVLEGNTDAILKDMYNDLKELSEDQRYEEAIVQRNRILRFERFLQGRQLDKRGEEVFNQAEEGMESLRKLLLRTFPELPLPKRIECYDISNTNQQEITASMVVMTDGMIDKKQYRKFRIKDMTVQSDFEAMREVFQRRIKRETWPVPDLIVVDGGRPQVRTVMEVFAQNEYGVPFIGIAKNPDRLITGTPDMSMIRPPLNHPGFSLVRALRDESHRFAKKYHVLLRSKKNGILLS